MAKVKSPLMSLTASGTIGSTLTMLRQASRNIAKKKGRPGGQPSAAQLARRALYQARAASWHALTAPEKADWKLIGDARQITAFNAYMSAGIAGGTPPAGVAWDGGSTAWDGGSAVWS